MFKDFIRRFCSYDKKSKTDWHLILSKFFIFPFLGLGLTKLFQFPAEIASKFILNGSSSGGDWPHMFCESHPTQIWPYLFL